MKSFGTLEFEPAQQGQLDALCGVYAVVNFISRRLKFANDCQDRWDHSKRLLSHLDARGKFSVNRVSQDGFKNGQLQAAFNKLSAELKLGVKAKDLARAISASNSEKLYDFMSSLKDGEAVMIRSLVGDTYHWLLAHSAKDGEVTIDDSYPPARCEKVQKSDGRIKGADLENGLVFINA